MNMSTVWARILGLYVVIICIGMFEHLNTYKELIKEMSHSPSLNITFGLFTLLLGLAVVVTHNVYRGWPLIVTVLGYWICMKGIILLYFPAWVNQFIAFWQDKNFNLALIPGLSMGIILLYCGFCIKPKPAADL